MHSRHRRHLRRTALEQWNEFHHFTCHLPLRHALFPDICLVGKQSLHNKLLQLVPVTRSILLSIDSHHITYLWSSPRHWRHPSHSRHRRNAWHLWRGRATLGLCLSGLHAGIEVRLVCTHEICFSLQAGGALQFFTLYAHRLALVLQLHALHFFLSTEVHLLLSFQHTYF